MCLEVRQVSPGFLNAVLDAFGHTRPKDAAISDLRMCKEGESTFRCSQPVASAQEARTRDLCVPAVSEQDPRSTAPRREEITAYNMQTVTRTPTHPRFNIRTIFHVETEIAQNMGLL